MTEYRKKSEVPDKLSIRDVAILFHISEKSALRFILENNLYEIPKEMLFDFVERSCGNVEEKS